VARIREEMARLNDFQKLEKSKNDDGKGFFGIWRLG
jgi:hypothetical protein